MKASEQKTACLYCNKDTGIQLPDYYAPVYMHCRMCTRTFIVERMPYGFQTIALESAPGCSGR